MARERHPMSRRPTRLTARLASLMSELRRRHVFRVAVVYSVMAFAMLQGVQLLAEGLDLPDWLFSAITLLTVVGFPVALVLAWALELTPHGVRRTPPSSPTPEPPADVPTGWRGWWPGLTAALGTALFAFGLWMVLDGTETRYDSIAVMPFVDLSQEGDSAHLGEGLAEELIHAFGNVRALKVAARTSTFSFRGREVDVREIGRALGVSTVLEGSVRRVDDQVRIVAQLIDASTGFRIWGSEYESSARELFALQNRIAEDIVERLAVETGAVDLRQLRRSGTRDPAAYALHFKARQRWAGRNAVELETALDELRRATALDPEFALAWSTLSNVIVALARREPLWRDALPEARSATLRALSITPDLPDAWASLGILIGETDLDWDTAERALGRAVAMRPSFAQAHQWLGDIQAYQGRWAEATASYERAVTLDPFSRLFRARLAVHEARHGDPERAFVLLVRLLDERPEDGEILARLAVLPRLPLLEAERAEYAVRWGSAAGLSDPEMVRLLTAANADPEQGTKAALELIDRIEGELGTIPELFEFAAALGLRERTLALLEASPPDAAMVLFGIGTDPLFAFLADEPRFTQVVERQRLPVLPPP